MDIILLDFLHKADPFILQDARQPPLPETQSRSILWLLIRNSDSVHVIGMEQTAKKKRISGGIKWTIPFSELLATLAVTASTEGAADVGLRSIEVSNCSVLDKSEFVSSLLASFIRSFPASTLRS